MVDPIEVQKHLKGVSYPASREELVQAARGNGADDELVGALENSGRDRFDGPNEVMEALRGSLSGN